MEGNNLAQQIIAIQRDPTLTDAEKAKQRQELLSGKWAPAQGTAGACMFIVLHSRQHCLRTASLSKLCVPRGQQGNSCLSGTTCHV